MTACADENSAKMSTLVQSTMNISSYSYRGSLASGSYMGGQASGQDHADVVSPH